LLFASLKVDRTNAESRCELFEVTHQSLSNARLPQIGSDPEALDFASLLSVSTNSTQGDTTGEVRVNAGDKEGPTGFVEFVKGKTVIIGIAPVSAIQLFEGAIDQCANGGSR
jgi:hypothetical protein